MLQPKRTKFRKVMKGRNTGLAQRANKVSFGEYGLKATSRGRITARQIEAARRTMTRRIKRGGKIWIRISRTSRSPASRLKFEWVKVKVLSSIGWLKSSQAACSTRWKALLKT